MLRAVSSTHTPHEALTIFLGRRLERVSEAALLARKTEAAPARPQCAPILAYTLTLLAFAVDFGVQLDDHLFVPVGFHQCYCLFLRSGATHLVGRRHCPRHECQHNS